MTSKTMSKQRALEVVRKDAEITEKALKGMTVVSKTHGTPETAYSYIPDGWRLAGDNNSPAPKGFFWIYRWNPKGTKITVALYNHEKWKHNQEKEEMKRKSRKQTVGQKSLSSFSAPKRASKKAKKCTKKRPSKVSVSSYTMPARTVPSHSVKAHTCKGHHVERQTRPSYKTSSYAVPSYKRRYPRK